MGDKSVRMKANVRVERTPRKRRSRTKPSGKEIGMAHAKKAAIKKSKTMPKRSSDGKFIKRKK